MNQAIQWGKISTPIKGRVILRGQGKTVEWTIMPPIGSHADECPVKISLLSARENYRREGFNRLDNIAANSKLSEAGKLREAHIYYQKTTVGNWEFFRTGSQSEALAIIDAFERNDNEAVRPKAALEAAGFKFRWFHGDLESPVWTYHKSLETGFFVLHISRDYLSLQYEPNPGGMGYIVFFVSFADGMTQGSRMTTLWPENVRFPLRKAVAIAMMMADIRTKSGQPSEPAQPAPFPEFA